MIRWAVAWLFSITLTFPAIAWAQYVDRAGNVVGDDGGGGAIPGLAVVAGCIGAVWFAYTGFRDGGGLGDIFGMAWMGFFAGVLVGLPIACAMR